MNVRIEELADKAVEDIPAGAWNIPDEFCEKFVELIVRECATIIDAIPTTPQGAWSDGYYEGCRDSAKAVREHFGVEAIVELAIKRPDNLEEVAKVIGWRTRLESPPFGRWLKILSASLKTPISEQVELRVASQSLPPIKIWKEKNPLGYARLTHARAALIELSMQLQIPSENLITPDYVKRICWQEPPKNKSDYESFVAKELNRLGARSWQVEQVVSVITPALSAIEPLLVPESAETENEPPITP